jgi:hypothetical protein
VNPRRLCLTSVAAARDDAAAGALKDRRSAAAAPGDGFAGRSMDAEDLSRGTPPAAWCSGEGARSAGLLGAPAAFASLLTRGADVALRLDGFLWLESSERPFGLHSVIR